MAEKDQSKLGISLRLKVAREQSGLSQGQVARMLSMHRPTISEIEAGRRRVSSEELSKFADIYNVSISWLATDKPEMPDPKIELAARELAKLKPEDIDTVLQLLKTLRKTEKSKK